MAPRKKITAMKSIRRVHDDSPPEAPVTFWPPVTIVVAVTVAKAAGVGDSVVNVIAVLAFAAETVM
jgi:hypothetical protein